MEREHTVLRDSLDIPYTSALGVSSAPFPYSFQETVLRRERGSGHPETHENSGVRGPCKVQSEEMQVFAFRPPLFAGITGELIRNMDLGLPGLAKPMPAT